MTAIDPIRARTMTWIALADAQGLAGDAAVQAAAAWLDRMDRALLDPMPCPAGRGIHHVVAPLCAWLPDIDPEADSALIRRGLRRLSRCLRAAGYAPASAPPRPAQQGLFALLVVLSGGDRATRRAARAAWSPAHHRIWRRLGRAALCSMGRNIAHLRGEGGSAQLLQASVYAMRQARDVWVTWDMEGCATWVPTPHAAHQERPSPGGSGSGVIPPAPPADDPQRDEPEREDIFKRWMNALEMNQTYAWIADLRFAVYGRRRAFSIRAAKGGVAPSDGATPHKGQRARGPLRSRGGKGYTSSGRADDAEIGRAGPPAPSRAGGARRTGADRAYDGQPARHSTVPVPPDGLLIPADPGPEPRRGPWATRPGRRFSAEARWAGTADLPLLHTRRCLPGRGLAVVANGLLTAPGFSTASLTDQSLFVALLCAVGLGQPVERLARARLIRSAPGPHDGEMLVDLDRGVMWFRPDVRLQACLSATTIAAPCDPVYGGHWPLPLPPAVVGLLRLHRRAVAKVRRHPRAHADTCLWVQPSDGSPARPLAAADVDRHLERWTADLVIPARRGDLTRVAEALAWQTDSPVPPGLLPSMSGAYRSRLAVASTYHAPSSPETARAAADLLRMAVAEIGARLQGYCGTESATRLACWLAEGVTRGAAPGLSEQEQMRIGTPRHLQRGYIARVLLTARDAAQDSETASLDDLRWRCAVEIRIFLALRAHEMHALRVRDVDVAPEGIHLYLTRKSRGDAIPRPDHLVVPRLCEPALRALMGRLAGRPDRRLFPPGLMRPLAVALPHAVRHSLSTAALEHYRDLGWTPGTWAAVQSALGHDIAGMPCGRDDELTLADRAHAMRDLTEKYLDDLLVAPRTTPPAALPTTCPAGQPFAPRRESRLVRPRPLAPYGRPRRVDPVAADLRATARADARSAGQRRMLRWLAARLESAAWPAAAAARRQLLRSWSHRLTYYDADPDAADSRAVIERTGLLLCAAGRLETPFWPSAPAPAPREREWERGSETTGGVGDPAGLTMAADARALLRHTLACSSQPVIDHVRVAALALLLLQCGVPDLPALLPGLRWSHVDWQRRHLVLRNAGVRHYVPLGPALELALHILQRHPPNRSTRIFPDLPALLRAPASADSTAECARVERVRVRVRALLDDPKRRRALAAAHAREHLPGFLVDAVVTGASVYRPILRGDSTALLTHIQRARCPTDGPVTARDAAGAGGVPPLPRTRRAKRGARAPLPDAVEAILMAVRRVLKRGATARGRAALAAALRRHADDLLALAHLPRQIDLARALRDLGTEPHATAPYLNLAVVLRYVAHRLPRPRKRWLAETETTRDLVAVATLRGYFERMVGILRRAGAVPLTVWMPGLWRRSTDTESTVAHRATALGQVRIFAAYHLGLVGLPSWVEPSGGLVGTEAVIPTAEQIDQIYDALRCDPLGDDLVLWFGAAHMCGIRPGEASALLIRDLDLGIRGGCFVHQGHAKDGEGRWAATLDIHLIFREALQKRMNEAPRRPGRPEPPLLRSAVRPAALRRLERRMAEILAPLNMHLYLLRHLYVSQRDALALAATGDPAGAWPEPVRQAARELNPFRAVAHEVGHSSTTQTGTTYDQALLWRVERRRATEDADLLTLPITMAHMQRVFRLSPHTVGDLMRRVGLDTEARRALTVGAALAALRTSVAGSTVSGQ